MGRGGHDVSVWNRGRIVARGDEAGKVRHVHQQDRAGLGGNPRECGEIDRAGIRTVAGDDHFWPVLEREGAHLGVVDQPVVAQAVVDRAVENPRKVHRRTVRQVSALGEIESEDGVTGLEEREVDGGIRLRPGVRLHVGVLGSEELLRAVDRELLHLVHHFTPAVVPLAGQSFGVLVVQRRAHRLEHRR